MSIKIQTATSTDLLFNPVSFLCGVSCTQPAPVASERNGSPLPGTRGAGGLAAQIVISVGLLNFFAGPQVTYTLQVTQTGRDGYNQGGTSASDAPLVAVDCPEYGSVYPAEPGQYYKVHLSSNQLIYLDGQATAGTLAGSYFQIDILDSNGVFIKPLVEVAAYGTKPFWTTGTPYTYMNTGADADFYLRVFSKYYMTWDFNFIVATPQLVVSPASLTRGQSATFTIIDARGATISSWQYTSTDHPTLNRSTNTSATTWAGTMVLSGAGHVTVGMAGSNIPLAAFLTVNPRNWSWTPRSPQKVDWGFVTPGAHETLRPANPPDGSVPDSGAGGLDIAWSTITASKIADGGPNDGFVYVINQVTDSNGTVPTQYYWTLAPDLENTSSTFYQKQCGTDGVISGADLLTGTTRHESAASNSHYANYVTAAAPPDDNLGSIAEGLIGDPSLTQLQHENAVTSALTTAATHIVAATRLENPPTGINTDASGQFLGQINYAPNYPLSCSGGV